MTNDRWERLFADLESWEPAHWDPAEVAELARAERVGVTLAERIAGALHSHITVTLRNSAVISGSLIAVADSWCVVRTDTADVVIPHGSIAATGPLGSPRPGSRPVPLGVVLRRIAQAGGAVMVETPMPIRGHLISVTADHLDLRDEHGAVLTIPFTAVDAVRTSPHTI